MYLNPRYIFWMSIGLVNLTWFRHGSAQISEELFARVQEGNMLENDVIASYRVDSLLECGQRCLQETACVFINYKSTAEKGDEVNCQLSEQQAETLNGTDHKKHGWILYKTTEVEPQVCSRRNPCKNGGECKTNTKKHKCTCKTRYEGKHCEKEKVFRSCKAIKSTAQNGAYRIQANTESGYTDAYCQMTPLQGCLGGGWTMAMKMDGNETTFHFASDYWKNTESYNPNGGLTGFDEQETKLPTYWSTPFTQLCVGMKVEGHTKFVSINYSADSLHSVIKDNQYHATHIGRPKWKSLITGSSLQVNCNEEGFNFIRSSHVTFRLGIAGNEGDDCRSPDSFLGFGGRMSPLSCIGSHTKNICGNFAGCQADNGNKIIKAMGYILVR